MMMMHSSHLDQANLFENKILKRWRTPSMLETLRLTGVLRMLICTTVLFFKYRILNKFVIIMWN